MEQRYDESTTLGPGGYGVVERLRSRLRYAAWLVGALMDERDEARSERDELARLLNGTTLLATRQAALGRTLTLENDRLRRQLRDLRTSGVGTATERAA